MGNREELGKNIRNYRVLRNMSQAELAESIGCAASTIAMYETGKREPDMDTIEAIADVFNIRIRDLVPDKSESISAKNIFQISDMSIHRVPLLGSAAAGEPINDEEVDVFIDGPLKADCAIRVKGESMEPTYLDGDVLYVCSQSCVDYDGQIAIVVCGDEACVKHVYRQQDGLLLTSDNPQYAPMFKRFDAYDNNIRVIGKVIGFTRIYKE